MLKHQFRQPVGRRARASRGQAMVEFALAGPVFFLLLMGIVEFGILLYDNTTTRFAASEAAKVEAQVGNRSIECDKFPGCVEVLGRPKLSQCDADCQAILAVHNTALGGLKLEQVNYIDVQQMLGPASGAFTKKVGSCQRYNFDGTPYTGPAGSCSAYPATGRGVVTGSMDYIQVNINFSYNWLTGLLRGISPTGVTLDSKFLVRLEPQDFVPPGP